MKMKATVLMPLATRAPVPDLARADDAADERMRRAAGDTVVPVMTFQVIAPTSAPNDVGVHHAGVGDALTRSGSHAPGGR